MGARGVKISTYFFLRATQGISASIASKFLMRIRIMHQNFKRPELYFTLSTHFFVAINMRILELKLKSIVFLAFPEKD